MSPRKKALRARSVLGGLMFEARRARGWSQGQVAFAVGCTTSHVSALERGEKAPTPAMLGRLLEAFEVPPARHDEWRAASLLLPPEIVMALLLHPARWDAVRKALGVEVSRG